MQRDVVTGPLARMLKSCLASVVGILLPSYFAVADSVTLVWDPNTEPDLAGYRIHYGTSSGQWNTTIDVGNVTNVTISGLARGVTYYFVATAYNTANLESDPSNEVSYAVPENVPPNAKGETLAIGGGKPATVNATKLLANDSDPDGDPLTIVDADATSAMGGTVIFDGATLVYEPPPGFSGYDTIRYAVGDNYGGTDVTTITVSVSSSVPAQHDVTLKSVSPKQTVLRFFGIPGQSYIVQAAPEITGPWTDLSPPLKAGPTGMIEFADTTWPKPATRFYRRIAAP